LTKPVFQLDERIKSILSVVQSNCFPTFEILSFSCSTSKFSLKYLWEQEPNRLMQRLSKISIDSLINSKRFQQLLFLIPLSFFLKIVYFNLEFLIFFAKIIMKNSLN